MLLAQLLAIPLVLHAASTSQGAADASLPGKGLAHHPFLYCGSADTRRPGHTMYIVRRGEVVWSYTLADGGELGDCTMLSNSHILFARKTGASEITLDKRIVWNYDAPEGTEIYTAQPIGLERVLVMLNGKEPRVMVIEKANGRVRQEIKLTALRPDRPGEQFRRVRLTATGTFLVAHTDVGKVAEYDPRGREMWSVAAPSASAAVRLSNGNTLISGNQYGYVREVNSHGELVWELNRNDLPGITLHAVQEVTRLANGNTLINNRPGRLPQSEWPTVVQLVEVTRDKKVVWGLRDWDTLGPPWSTQILDEPGLPERGQLR
jgi:outer membrane protein assembly factor BamB